MLGSGQVDCGDSISRGLAHRLVDVVFDSGVKLTNVDVFSNSNNDPQCHW